MSYCHIVFSTYDIINQLREHAILLRERADRFDNAASMLENEPTLDGLPENFFTLTPTPSIKISDSDAAAAENFARMLGSTSTGKSPPVAEYNHLTLQDGIVQILKDAGGPLKKSEILRKLRLHKVQVSSKESLTSALSRAKGVLISVGRGVWDLKSRHTAAKKSGKTV